MLCTTLSVSAQKYVQAYDAGNYEKAIKYAEKTIDDEPKNLEAYLYKAMSNLHLGTDELTRKEHPFGIESSLGTLKLIIKKDKTGSFVSANQIKVDSIIFANYLLADEYVANGKSEKALRILNDLIAIKPLPAYYYQIGNIYLADGNQVAAIKMFNDAAAKIYLDAKDGIKPADYLSEVYVILADNLADNGDLNSAYTIYNRALNLFPPTLIRDDYSNLLLGLVAQLNYYSDTTKQLNFIANLDTAATFTDSFELFNEIKWKMLWQYFNRKSEYDYYGAAAVIKRYACNENRVDVLPVFYEQIFTNTHINNTIEGITLSDGRNYLRTWVDIQNCLSAATTTKDAVFYAVMDSLLSNKRASYAFKWLHNIKMLDADPKKVAKYEVELYQLIKVTDTANFSFNDLYTAVNFFPANKNLKALLDNGAYAEIVKLIEKKKFSEAGQLLRQQIRQNPKDKYLNQLYRQWVISDYQVNYLGSAYYIESKDFGGDIDNCKAGKLSPEVQALFLQRLNYFRRIAGVPDQCELRESWNQKCQAAAALMSANGDLSHFPPKTWNCYSNDGATGAGNSNLSLGYSGGSALGGQLDDAGSNNYFVGHRRWILNPYRKVFGHGSTEDAMALWALGGENANYPTSVTQIFETQYICWPPEFYFPSDLYCARWSFSLVGADFNKAEVTMYQNNVKLDVVIQEYTPGYGINTLVWEPQKVQYSGESTFKVTIKNVVFSEWDDVTANYKTTVKSFTYTTTMLEVR